LSAPKPAAGVAWAVDAQGVRVTRAGAVVATLTYPEAAVWDFVVRGINDARTRVMVRHIGGFATETEAAALVEICVERWRRDGLIADASGGHGQHLTDPAL
jgi:hypothetical protein